MSVFNYEKDQDGIVTITMDMNGPVNAMNSEFDAAFLDAVNKLEAEEGLTGVVFASAKKTFFAGGDLNWLLSVEPGTEQELFDKIEASKAVMRRVEKLPVPVVAAINGAALGGGFELCLMCNYRIALDSKAVQLGLPEVGLGLLPGAGGIVRTVNLIGLEKALPFLLEGKRVNPQVALGAGLIQETVGSLEELLPRAKAVILEGKDNEEAAAQPWDRKGFKIPGGGANSPHLQQILMMAPVMLAQKTRGLLPAPERILNVAVEATRLDFDTALRVEGRNFTSLVTTPEAKNMITAFFFQMNQVNGGASRPAGVEPSKVQKVGVLGAGMMGQGIAYVSAMAGIEVVLKDISLEAAEKGKAYTEALLQKRVAKGRMDEGKMAGVLGLIKATDSNDDLNGCDLIIEAVFENIDLKHKITKETEGCLADNGVWGSNTSTLPITRLAEASSKPANFVGIHFFSPVDKMPLVELICGEQTSDETLARAFDYCRQIKKTPIVVNDSLGFYTSRTILTQGSEAQTLVSEGVHPVRVDSAGKAIGLPVGPLTLGDEISYTLPLDIRSTHINLGLIQEDDDPTPQATQILKEMVDMGRVGKKAGKGFYDYDENGKSISQEVVDKYYKADYEISEEDIKDRLLFRPVIESLKCLEEGVLRTVADGNIGSIMGIGAPVWTGGYIQFVNTYGVQNFVERCNQLAEQYGERFAPPAIAVEYAQSGKLFA